MSSILFIHGFATGPTIWKDQVREFAHDFQVTTDLSHVEKAEDLYIVGWSMGGWKAMELAMEHHQKIKGLILVSAFAKYVTSDDYPAGTSAALLRRLEKKFIKNYKDGMRYFYGLVFADKDRHKLIDHLPPPTETELKHWLKKLGEYDLRSQLSKIKVPTLIIQGDQDQIVNPLAADYLLAHIPQAELHHLPGAGHVPFVEQKQEFNALLRNFIEKVEKS